MHAVLTRLKEPSSWASIAVALGVFGVTFTDGLWEHIVSLGTAAAAFLGFFLPENKA